MSTTTPLSALTPSSSSPRTPSSTPRTAPEIHHDARPMFCLNCNAELMVDPFDDAVLAGGSPKSIEVNSHDPEPSVTGTLGHYTTRQAKLLAMVAESEAPLENPMCQECCDALLEVLDTQLTTAERECRDYQQVLDQLTTASNNAKLISGDAQARQKHLSSLKADEASLNAQLRELLLEEKKLDKELSAAEKDNHQLARERERLWHDYRDGTRKLLDMETDETTVSNRLAYVNEQLTRLSKTNVLNMAFHIWHDGVFGTINGLRLGRVPETPVEWSEINTAWGHSALVLTCLARKVDFKFERYAVRAFGSTSYMTVIGDDTSNLPLYNMGGVRFLGNARFDAAMIAFLDCMQQMEKQIDLKSPGFKLPYVMRLDKLVDKEKEYSVKTEFNSEERWTKAMKYLLTNMKWMLAWIASLHA